MFTRFITNRVDRDSNRQQGLIATIEDLQASNRLTPNEDIEATTVLKWLFKHLPMPNRKVPKHAVFWFKKGNEDLIAKFLELASISRRHGHPVQEIKTDRPGYVIYEDKYQVGAVPFKDTFDR